MKLIKLFLIIVIFQSICYSQWDRLRRDGLWWLYLQQEPKMNYVLGYYSSMDLGAELVIDGFELGSKCQNISKKNYIYYEEKIKRIDIGKLISKVDSVYQKDPKNAGLMVFHTFWLCINELIGENKIKIKNMLETYMKEDCSKFKNLDQLRQYNKPY